MVSVLGGDEVMGGDWAGASGDEEWEILNKEEVEVDEESVDEDEGRGAAGTGGAMEEEMGANSSEPMDGSRGAVWDDENVFHDDGSESAPDNDENLDRLLEHGTPILSNVNMSRQQHYENLDTESEVSRALNGSPVSVMSARTPASPKGDAADQFRAESRETVGAYWRSMTVSVSRIVRDTQKKIDQSYIQIGFCIGVSGGTAILASIAFGVICTWGLYGVCGRHAAPSAHPVPVASLDSSL